MEKSSCTTFWTQHAQHEVQLDVRPWCLSQRARALGLPLAALAAAATTGFVLAACHGRLRSRLLDQVEMASDIPCDAFDLDTVYWTRRTNVGRSEGVADEGACRQLCVREPSCMCWSFGKRPGVPGLSNVCFLKELEQDERPVKQHQTGLVSGGLPCHMAPSGAPGTLFCFTVLRRGSPEWPLLEVQRRLEVGIFACDRHAVYSNESFEARPGLWTLAFDGQPEAKSGGELSAAQNMDTFMAAWALVARDGHARSCDWTVKVDPSTLFLPERLRGMLPHHREAPEGVYLNNCRFGMQGAIEVFSRNAVEAWITRSAECFWHFTELCSGPCGWGEDTFLDECFSRVLQVRRDNEWNLLNDGLCTADPEVSPNWAPHMCTTSHAAFHPLVTKDGLSQCLWNSRLLTMQHFKKD